MSTGGITSSRVHARTPLLIDILNSPQNCLIRARASAHVCDVGQRGPFLAPPRAFRTPSSWTEAPRPAGAAAPRAGVTRPRRLRRVGRSYARGKLLREVLMQGVRGGCSGMRVYFSLKYVAASRLNIVATDPHGSCSVANIDPLHVQSCGSAHMCRRRALLTMAPRTMAPITRAIPTKVCRRRPLRSCGPLARIAGGRAPAHYAAAAIAREQAAAIDWGRHGRTTSTPIAAGAGGATGTAPCHAAEQSGGASALGRAYEIRAECFAPTTLTPTVPQP
eukprot:scaffold61299_cov59-Phaeocystis_antarctica.AAC.2